MNNQSHANKNIPELVSWAYHKQIRLELTTEHLAFLLAIKNWTNYDDENYLSEKNFNESP